MKKEVVLFIVLIIAMFVIPYFVSAACSRPVYSKDLNTSTRLCGENFVVNNGLVVSKDNVDIDCSSVVLKGNLLSVVAGIVIEDRKNITLYDCRIVNYATGIKIINSSGIVLRDMTFLRNFVGVHIIDSFNVSIINSFDISLDKPLKISNVTNSTFQYYNKKIKGDFCNANNCGNRV